MKGKIEITKEKFVALIEAIKTQTEHDIQYCNKLGEALHPHIEMYNNSFLLNPLVKLLEEAFDDKEGGWIGYFCWELDFGEAYTLGTARRKDGSNIDLSSAATLYDFLTETYFLPGEKVVLRDESNDFGFCLQYEVIVQKGDKVYIKDNIRSTTSVDSCNLKKDRYG